jgi:2-desacetyl-2-hydroxyethyl bacteriochlorophyllide A dehydrogenase
MKAAIFMGAKDVAVTVKDTPTPGPHDVLLRNIRAGICGSDVAAFQHGPGAHKIMAGREFGHEVVSEVYAKGNAVTDLAVGDRVYPYPLLATGDPARAGAIGGFSEFILVPNAQLGREVYRVDDAISSDAASMIEPFTVGARAARRARPAVGETAIVLGAGTIGAAAAMTLQTLGCGEVLVADPSSFRREHLAALGFCTCGPEPDELKATAIELFGEAPSLDGTTANADIFIDATNGANGVIGQYQSMAKILSRLVVAGVHETPVSIDLPTLAFAWQELIGSGGYLPEDVDFVMELLRSHKFDVESLITHSYPLQDIVTALETASDPEVSLHVSITY